MRCYIAGPMSGIENYNWPEFENAMNRLPWYGLTPVSPTVIDEDLGVVDVVRGSQGEVLFVDVTDKFDYNEVLRRDLEEIEGCSMIYLLKGWSRSTGALRELRKAIDCGLTVFTEEGGDFVD